MDSKTGSQVQCQTIEAVPGSFGCFFYEGFDRLAADKNLTAVDYRILLFIVRHASRSMIVFDQHQVAALMGITRPMVCRSFKRLVDRGYLVKDRVNAKNVYRIPVAYFWKGGSSGSKKNRLLKTSEIV